MSPLSPTETRAAAIQSRLWAHHRRFPDDAAYNETVELSVPGAVDASQLRQCIRQVTARHASLRTVFTAHHGGIFQNVELAFALPIHADDVSQLPVDERLGAARRLGHALARVPFDLERTPLLRVLLVRLDDREHRIYLTLHHAVCDARSLYNLVAELAALLDASARGRAPVLPPLSVQFADIVAGPGIAVPLPRARGATAGARLDVSVSPDLADAARALAASERTTVATVMLAAWHALLRRLGHGDHLTTATVASPRVGRGEAHVIGPLFDVVPIARTDDARPFHSQLADLRQELHRDRTREYFVADVSTATAGFTLVPAAPRLAGGCTADLFAVASGAAKDDLHLVLRDDDAGGFSGYIEYRTARHHADTVSELARRYPVLLGALVDEAHEREPRVA